MWFMAEPVSTWHVHAAGLSRTTALDRNMAVDALATMPRLIRTDPDFPSWYADLFERRWRFCSARLPLRGPSPDKELLAAMAPNTAMGQTISPPVGPLRPLPLR